MTAQERAKKIHQQIERLYSKHGVESFVSISLPDGSGFEIATARKGTLKQISNNLNKKLNANKIK